MKMFKSLGARQNMKLVSPAVSCASAGSAGPLDSRGPQNSQSLRVRVLHCSATLWTKRLRRQSEPSGQILVPAYNLSYNENNIELLLYYTNDNDCTVGI